MTENPVKPVKLTHAAAFFLVLAVLGWIAGTAAPIWAIFGSVFGIIAGVLLILWWINARNGRDV